MGPNDYYEKALKAIKDFVGFQQRPERRPPGKGLQRGYVAPSGYYEKALKAIKDFVGFQSPRTYTPVGSTRTSVGSGLQRLDLAGRYVTRLTGRQTVEEPLGEESKIYSNRSKTAILTKEISISHSITRTVTMQERKLKAYTAEAGIAPVGFGAIRAQVQQQLDQVYSVATQSSLTMNEKTTITIQPASTVVHVIQWKRISLHGIAILGGIVEGYPQVPFEVAEIPYRVPQRLTYTDYVKDYVPKKG